MATTRKELGSATRRAVCRILGSADSLPERSKASKVLTTVACRLQLFVFELERARFEHFGLGIIIQLLERCIEHCQLLNVASHQGGGVQSGYALLSELSELLQELEGSVLLLPGQLGSDARYKPALDELQALLVNVSHYRAECEDTKRHLEAALSELVHGCATPAAAAAAAAEPVCGTAAWAPAPPPPAPLSVSNRRSRTSSSGAPCDEGDTVAGVKGAAAGDVAVLHRVRQVICGLDLDVDMAERDQDLDAELLQLRDQMQQALQEREEPHEGPGQQHHQEQQHPQQHLELDELDPQSYGVRQGGGLVRLGARRRAREPPAAVAAAAASAADESSSWSSLSPASSMSTGGGGVPRVSRLHAARRVSRRLAAQHLARLKEQQRQLRMERAAAVDAGEAAGSSGGEDAQPAARRRRVQVESDGVAVAGGATGPAAIAELGINGIGSAGATAGAPGAALASASSAANDPAGIGAASTRVSSDPRVGAGAPLEAGSDPLTERKGGEEAAGRLPGGPTVPRQNAAALAAAAAAAAATVTGPEAAATVGQAGAAVARRPNEASVIALRKLNRVTQLAGMWEAGRPVAQQGASEEYGSGSFSDCESEPSSGGSDAGGELPARPAPRRPSVAAVSPAAPPFLPALPDLPGQAGRVAASSPFFMLAIQGRAPKAPPPPVLGRLLAPPPAAEGLLDETPASPAAAHAGGGANSPLGSPTAAAAAAGAGGMAPGGQRLRGAAAGAAAPAPLPLPDASVHLRAVGLPGCFAPHWVPPGPFGLPAHAAIAAAAAAAGGLWLVGGVGAVPAAAAGEGEGEGNASGGVAGGGGEQLLDFGPDVPTLDLHRDITGWGPCLGRGAFGAVYKAIFRNKPAAVKVLHGGALDVRELRSLRTEISLLCRLRHHPNIITVYGAAAAPPDHVALVTELMDCDLYDYIHRRRQNCVPLDEVLSIARAIASGLSELHPTIVHRDLKPANVLLRHSATPPTAAAAAQQQPAGGGGPAAALDRRLTVKIADFGLARHKRSQYLSTRERDAGTLKYMAPECIARGGGSGGANGNDGGEGEGGSGGGITEKCDIYSFGVLLYELITGREPWEGCHPLYAMCQVQSGVTLQLPDDPARCPPCLRSMVLRCWSYQHQQRPTSRELLRELDELIAGRQQQQLAAEEGGGVALAEAHAPPPWQ